MHVVILVFYVCLLVLIGTTIAYWYSDRRQNGYRKHEYNIDKILKRNNEQHQYFIANINNISKQIDSMSAVLKYKRKQHKL